MTKEYINFISTKEAAEILQVSVSTVRRLADKNSIECYKTGNSNYRKFPRESIIKYKEEYYKVDNVSKKTETVKNINNISAKSHPRHYLMHKYWGRKAHNVIHDYINHFTEEGETVLDPFMGSGVTVIESIKSNRKAIGVDINPMSTFIVNNTISKVDLNEFKIIYNTIYTKVYNQYHNLYDTECPICKKQSVIETSVWEEDTLKRLKGICSDHGTFIKDASHKDIVNYNECTNIKNKLLQDNHISFPRDEIMKYVKRSGRERIDELFSDRALVILSKLRDEINKISNLEIKNLLFFCFTSMLSNVSRMLPGDLKKSTYKSGWVISKFWTPKVHTERNIFKCFDLRFKAIYKGKEELKDIKSDLAKIILGNSTKLKNIEDNSIGYIFTDPPYGESIAYLALSQFWNSWTTHNVDYLNEIIIDPYRKKDYVDYENRMSDVFKELYRVLKPERYMSFTFHNRDMNVWKAILNSCLESGFVLESIVLQEQAVSSGTQGINKKNTLTGDFVYNFKKTNTKQNTLQKISSVENFIKNEINNFVLKNNGATPTELYEYLIPIIVRNHAYEDDNGNIINIDKILKDNFEYIEIENDKKQLGTSHKWVKKTK